MKRNTLVKAFCVGLLMSSTLLLHAQGPSNCGQDLETLTVGSNFSGNLGYPPFEVLNIDLDPNVLQGFDVAVACEVAHRLGFRNLTFQQIPFNQLFDALLRQGTIDIAMSAISITKARKAIIGLSFVKYNNDDNLGIVVGANLANIPGITDPETTLERLNELGGPVAVPVAVVRGTRQEEILNGPAYPNLARNLEPVNNVSEGVTMIQAGDIAALFTDGPTARDLAAQDTNKFLVPVEMVEAVQDPGVQSEGLGIAIGTECCQLYANIVQAVADMAQDGTLEALRNEFNVGSFSEQDITPSECEEVDASINSNGIYNQRFGVFCDRCEPAVS